METHVCTNVTAVAHLPSLRGESSWLNHCLQVEGASTLARHSAGSGESSCGSPMPTALWDWGGSTRVGRPPSVRAAAAALPACTGAAGALNAASTAPGALLEERRYTHGGRLFTGGGCMNGLVLSLPASFLATLTCDGAMRV